MPRFKKHGIYDTHTYMSWRSIINRCYNPKQGRAYARYGARGIRACEFIRLSPLSLVVLIGHRPDTETQKYTIDRIHNEYGYYCGQCAECLTNGWDINIQWSTPVQQARNRSTTLVIEIDGVKKCAAQWADDNGINRQTLHQRLKRGISGKDLINPIC